QKAWRSENQSVAVLDGFSRPGEDARCSKKKLLWPHVVLNRKKANAWTIGRFSIRWNLGNLPHPRDYAHGREHREISGPEQVRTGSVSPDAAIGSPIKRV